mgnify:CR=1 FL=1
MDNEKDLEKLDCNGECEGCDGCDDMEELITLKDEETGEEFQFAYVDAFDFNNEKYCVLLTMDEEPEMIIFKEVEGENGEINIESLDESEEDAVYDYYDSLCDEYFEDEDDNETEK